jgi:GTP pyrophosphokinase
MTLSKMMTIQDIDKNFEEFLNVLKKDNYGEEYLGLIKKAYEYSKKAHGLQKRKSGEPYLIHPVEVAKLTYKNNLGTHSIIAALLHDTVEDTEITLEDITKEFGEEISKLVDGLTKINTYKKSNVKNFCENTLKKILMITIKDVRVLIIKLCDRLHNIQTIKGLTEERRIEYSNETMEIYVPIAQKVGLYKIKWKLEDLCLKNIHKESYQKIKEKIGLKIGERKIILNEILEDVNSKLKNKMTVEYKIQGRIKNFYSIYRKMILKKRNFETIDDLFAIRIIVEDVPSCYLAFGIIQGTFQTKYERVKDYISNPKTNGYESIHTTVISKINNLPIEIQIKTQKMNDIAEYGIAAHYKYKNVEGDKTFDKKILWLKELFDFEKEHKDDLNIDFINILKNDFFEDEIYLFTPKNKLITLPKNSIALDFAYIIHTELGNTATKVQINGENKPLDCILKNGDKIKIFTQKNLIQSSKYLKTLKTTKAKLKLRDLLKLKMSKSNHKIITKSKEGTNKNVINYIKDIDNYKNAENPNCCELKKGDEIIGIQNKVKFAIHNKNCETLQNNKNKENIVELKWLKLKSEKVLFKVLSKENIGLLGSVLNILNEHKISIFSSKGKVTQNETTILEFEILKNKEIQKLKKEITDLETVYEVQIIENYDKI